VSDTVSSLRVERLIDPKMPVEVEATARV